MNVFYRLPKFLISKPNALKQAILLFLPICLSACQTLDGLTTGDRVAYEQAKASPDLIIPNNLNHSLDEHERLYVPKVSLNDQQKPLNAIDNSNNSNIKLSDESVSIIQSGKSLGIHIKNYSAQNAWPKLLDFWKKQGFNFQQTIPSIGFIRTNWAENRANIPNDVFRNTLGRLIDWAYSSGTQDSYETRLERSSDRGINILITHYGMEEVLIGRDKDSSRWHRVKRNHNLEQALLEMLAQDFGVSANKAKSLFKLNMQREEKAGHSSNNLSETTLNAQSIVLNEPFNSAWPRIGIALEQIQLKIEQNNIETGRYVVRDSVSNKNSSNQVNSSNDGNLYQIALNAIQSDKTQITIHPTQENLKNQSASESILKKLAQQLK